MVISLVGSGVFLALVWLTFDVHFLRALTAAVVTMTSVAVLDYFAPQAKVHQLLIVAVVAGIIVGLGVWWVLPYVIPWYYYAIPFAILACIEALLERWSDRYKKMPT